jgi:hypothetical protein
LGRVAAVEARCGRGKHNDPALPANIVAVAGFGGLSAIAASSRFRWPLEGSRTYHEREFGCGD